MVKKSLELGRKMSMDEVVTGIMPPSQIILEEVLTRLGALPSSGVRKSIKDIDFTTNKVLAEHTGESRDSLPNSVAYVHIKHHGVPQEDSCLYENIENRASNTIVLPVEYLEEACFRCGQPRLGNPRFFIGSVDPELCARCEKQLQHPCENYLVVDPNARDFKQVILNSSKPEKVTSYRSLDEFARAKHREYVSWVPYNKLTHHQ